MFAVIRTGGKQHRVVANDRIVIEKIEGQPGELVAFEDVLMLSQEGQAPLIGAAVPAEARVFARVVSQERGPKIIVFKKRRRKHYRRKKGHRQHLTVVKIAAISASGEAPATAEAEATPAAGAPVATTPLATSPDAAEVLADATA